MDTTRHSILRHGAAAAAGGVAANVVVFGAGAAVGIGYLVGDGQSSNTVTAADVVIMSAAPILGATVVAALMRRRSHIRRLQVFASAVTMLSLGGPLSMGIGAGTKAVLAVMHVIAGACLIVALQHAIRNEEPAREAGGTSPATRLSAAA